MAEEWHVGSQNDGLCVIDRKPSPAGTDVVWEGRKDLQHICCVDGESFEVRQKRANLIAAAPELLAAAKDALAYMSGNRVCKETLLEAIRKAG